MPSRAHEAGQGLVEFSLAITVFMVMVLALFDLGHGVYTYNGLSEAGREIARRTIVYPGIVLGASAETLAVVATQHALVPGMSNPTFACVDVAGTIVAHSPCESGDYVQVTVTAAYTPISPLGIAGPINMTSSASMIIP